MDGVRAVAEQTGKARLSHNQPSALETVPILSCRYRRDFGSTESPQQKFKRLNASSTDSL